MFARIVDYVCHGRSKMKIMLRIRQTILLSVAAVIPLAFAGTQRPYEPIQPIPDTIILNPDKVKLVIKHFPLSKHRYARKAAAAALAAASQGKFWEFHHKLFQNYKSINNEKIQQIAKELNLEMKKFNKDMASSAVHALINRDLKNGRQIGVRATPSIFINGKILKPKSVNDFYRAIDDELTKRR